MLNIRDVGCLLGHINICEISIQMSVQHDRSRPDPITTDCVFARYHVHSELKVCNLSFFFKTATYFRDYFRDCNMHFVDA